MSAAPAQILVRAAARLGSLELAGPAEEAQHDSTPRLLLRRRMKARPIAPQLLHETHDATNDNHGSLRAVFLSNVRTVPIASVHP